MSLCLSASTLPLLRRGLENWLEAWDLRLKLSAIHSPLSLSLSEDTPTKMDGFARHAREYQILALAKLDKLLDCREVAAGSITLGLSRAETILDVKELILMA